MTTGGAHESHGDSDFDGESERRSLIRTTVVVGVLLGCDVLLNLMGAESSARPLGIRLALVSAIIGEDGSSISPSWLCCKDASAPTSRWPSPVWLPALPENTSWQRKSSSSPCWANVWRP